MAMENGTLTSDVPNDTSIQFGDFPASHVWWDQRVCSLSSWATPRIPQSLILGTEPKECRTVFRLDQGMMFCSGVLASIGDLCFEVINQYSRQENYWDVCLYVRRMSRNILWIYVYVNMYIYIIYICYGTCICITISCGFKWPHWQSNVWLCVSRIACQDDRRMSVTVYNAYTIYNIQYAIYNIQSIQPTRSLQFTQSIQWIYTTYTVYNLYSPYSVYNVQYVYTHTYIYICIYTYVHLKTHTHTPPQFSSVNLSMNLWIHVLVCVS